MKQMKKGFTLIELMIVVAIIGVLAAVAIPKFADLIRKAQEAACKGQLGAVRSALSIYYGNMEGVWPSRLAEITPTYIQAIPDAKCGSSLVPTSDTVTYEGTGTSLASINANTGGWWFNNGKAAPGGTYEGQFKVNCIATDTKGSIIHEW
ncbi:prepilin-type N-terminal cleavage/methylation domain-containing protein [bacterium]|nr:prepilin-type N-terminal cleavage/methylation domain-containing protein [bacterium]